MISNDPHLQPHRFGARAVVGHSRRSTHSPIAVVRLWVAKLLAALLGKGVGGTRLVCNSTSEDLKT